MTNQCTAVYTKDTGTIRVFFNGNGYDNRDEFEAVVSVMHLKEDVVLLYAAHGKLNKRAILSILKTLYELGNSKAQINRAKGRVMPFGYRIVKGHKENLWEVDLVALFGGNHEK